jgi:hypothetical protein
MFCGCNNLKTFESKLEKLTEGFQMFCYCNSLSSFHTNLPSLLTANSMFYNCKNLSSFTSDLSLLADGTQMFLGCSNLIAFNSKLKSLTNGTSMFCDCKKLNTFDYNLSSLTNARSMFCRCENLISFSSNLNSLIEGIDMFFACKLDAPSIKNIINTINTVESANLTLGMGCDNNNTDKDLFAQEVGYPDMSTLLQTIQNKGWTVGAQFTGRPSSTFSLRKPEYLPVYVKLVEVIPTEEDSIYEYTSQGGTKFYNLDWFHETTGSTDGYTQFSSLEEAITHFKLLNKA